MNTIWSKYIQGAKTLYYSRKLRFDDIFKDRYKPAFALDGDKPLKILEIGCGPGALAGALHRWYPKAEITGVDLDSELIRFAGEHEKGVVFKEGDATSLPFDDESFDAVASDTVCEHIDPEKFYKEQLRVLKKGGTCLVLSARRGISAGKEEELSEYERKFWEKVEKYDDIIEKFQVGKYAMNEAELPKAMEAHGFTKVTTDFAVIPLTPDDPKFSPELARDMINADRRSDIERLDSVLYSLPEHFNAEETERMKKITEKKYDDRLAAYDRGEKKWDTGVSVTMIIRGVK